MELKAYIGGIPPHVHVNVPPGTAAVDYIDENGVVVAIVIHDIVSLDDIAKAEGANLTRVDIGEPTPTPTAVAAAATAAEAVGEADPAEAVDPPPDVGAMSFAELKDLATETKLKGRSGMSKDELVEALSG